MNTSSSLPQENKLTVALKIEAGCLGPTGEDLVLSFCELAKKEFESTDMYFLSWSVSPRDDKSQPEIQYQINQKTLDRDKTDRYLKLFNTTVDELENLMHNKLLRMIDHFMKNK